MNFKYKCKHCVSGFEYPGQLAVHMKVSHPTLTKRALRERQSRPYRCAKCDSSFPTLGGLRIHTSRMHGRSEEPQSQAVVSVPAEPVTIKSPMLSGLSDPTLSFCPHCGINLRMLSQALLVLSENG